MGRYLMLTKEGEKISGDFVIGCYVGEGNIREREMRGGICISPNIGGRGSGGHGFGVDVAMKGGD